MSERKTTRNQYDRFLDWCRRNKYLSIVLLVGTVLSAVFGVIQGMAFMYDLFQRVKTPHLELCFATESSCTHEFKISPRWQDTVPSGFSDPIPVSIALRNRGNAKAANVRVFLIYNAMVISLLDPKGKKIPRSLVTSATESYPGDYVSQYTVGEVDLSSIPILFEDELQLKVRLRALAGMPQFQDGYVSLQRVYVPFFHKAVSRFGLIPILYVITYAESAKPFSGILLLSIADTVLEAIKASATTPIEGKWIPETSKPQLGEPVSTKSKDLQAVTFGDKLQFTDIQAMENISDTAIWLELLVDRRTVYIEMDLNKDGFIDAIYLINPESEEQNWFHQVPTEQLRFIPIDYIIDMQGQTMKDFIVKRLFEGD